MLLLLHGDRPSQVAGLVHVTAAAHQKDIPSRARDRYRHHGLKDRDTPCKETKKQEFRAWAGIPRFTRNIGYYSTVTDLAKLRGWSTSQPRRTAMWYASSCSGTTSRIGNNNSGAWGT